MEIKVKLLIGPLDLQRGIWSCFPVQLSAVASLKPDRII